MTNWMTAAGIAFIAGGIATLICLRSVLFSRSKQPRRGAKQPVSRGAQRELEPPATKLPQRSSEREPRRTRPDLPDTAVTATANLDLPALRRPTPPDWPQPPRQTRRHGRHDDLSGGLASIGLADEENALAPVAPAEEELRPADDDVADELDRPAPAEPETEPLVTPGDEQSRLLPVRRVDRSDRAYGDRVDGWVRPEYHDDPVEAPSGEYWTPVPLDDLGVDLPGDDPEPSARGYGWPTQVERLPAVPDYEPATGFDLTPVTTEPTELVPTWPPLPDGHLDRIQLPRTWVSRDTKPSDNRFFDNEPRRTGPDTADQRFRAPTAEPVRRRPRPRPRPTATPDNVYVSRHAADPPH